MKVALCSVALPATLALAAALAACSSSTTIQTRNNPTTGTTEDPTDPAAPEDTTTPADPSNPKTPTNPADPADPTDPTDPATPTPMSDTPNIITTMMPSVATALAKGAVDVNNLPATIGALTSKQRSAVMSSFVAALGGSCTTCHASASDFSTLTPKMKITNKMWTNYVKGMTLKGGAKIYCDTCHQGSATFLDRRDDKALGNWMGANFVGALASTSGANTCATCHGASIGPILAAWGN